MYKIIAADGKEYGPITVDQLRQWITEGRANLQTQVLPDGATQWTTIGALPEFAGAAPGPAPIAPIQPVVPTGGTDQVNGPAVGLIVVAILGLLGQLTSLIFHLVGSSFMSANQPGVPPWAAMLSGPIGIASNIIGIVMSVVVILGALKMKKLENYGLAMAATIIAMIPCISPCCLLGLPIGIWALVVLLKPEVKSAFH